MLYKQIQKITKFKILLIFAAFVFVFSLSSSGLADALLGCSDNKVALPGTVCPDGSTPVKDQKLPAGCPGSNVQGPLLSDSNYNVVCPARPGRSECRYTLATNQCLNVNGIDITKGDPATTTASNEIIPEPDNRPQDCTGADIASGEEEKLENGDINPKHCGILDYITIFINVLSALVGIVVTAVIIWGGIEYSTSTGDPAKVQAAKKRIYNGILSLVVFIFAYAFLQWIVPGGIGGFL